MKIQLRMIVLVGALLSGGVMVGMEQARAIQAERFRQAEIERLSQEIAAINDQLAKLQQNKQNLLLASPDYQRAQQQIAATQAQLAREQQQLVVDTQLVTTTQQKIAQMMSRVNSLSENEQIELLGYQDNIQNFDDRVLRSQQAVAYSQGFITDLGKRTKQVTDGLEGIKKVEDKRHEALAQKQAELKGLKDQLKVRAQRPELGRNELKPATKPMKEDYKKDLPADETAGAGVRLSRKQKAALTGGVAAIAAGMFYVGLRWYQKKQISNAVAKYGRMQDDFSARQRDMMAAAVLASFGVPGTMNYLQSLINKYDVGSDGVSEDLMWQILAQLYWRKPIDGRVVQAFKIKAAGAR